MKSNILKYYFFFTSGRISDISIGLGQPEKQIKQIKKLRNKKNKSTLIYKCRLIFELEDWVSNKMLNYSYRYKEQSGSAFIGQWGCSDNLFLSQCRNLFLYLLHMLCYFLTFLRRVPGKECLSFTPILISTQILCLGFFFMFSSKFKGRVFNRLHIKLKPKPITKNLSVKLAFKGWATADVKRFSMSWAESQDCGSRKNQSPHWFYESANILILNHR